MNTPNEIVIRADQVKEGDVLVVPEGEGVVHFVDRFPRPWCVRLIERNNVHIRASAELVRVRRPVPTVTIEIELNEEEAERALNDLDGWQMYGSWHPLVARFRDAIRAARAKETTP